MEAEKLCPCGRPLHYSDAHVRELVERQIEEMGEKQKVTNLGTGRVFLVPRHFTALHGFKASELPGLVGRFGIEELR